jgi:hypothetical protein
VVFLKVLNAKLPFYFFGSAILLMLFVVVLFGWLVERAERHGAQKVFLGNTVSSIADAPNVIFDVWDTLVTTFKGVNPSIEQRYTPSDIEQFRDLAMRHGMPRISGPMVYASDEATPGYRVILGYF